MIALVGLLGGCWGGRVDPCQGGVWEGWVEDADGDGYGDAEAPLRGDPGRILCLEPDPNVTYVANREDCDDGDPGAFPGATEVCNAGADDDCDGLADDDDDDDDLDASGGVTFHRDADGDGFGDPSETVDVCEPSDGCVLDGTDCDEADAAVFPGALWHRDADRDGHGDPAAAIDICGDGAEPGESYVDADADCDDTDPDRNPDTVWYADPDGDGYGSDVDGVLADGVWVSGDGCACSPRPHSRATGRGRPPAWWKARPRAPSRRNQPPTLVTDEALVLPVPGLGVTSGDRVLLADVDLAVGAGQRVAVVGAVGAGKTVLVDVVTGLRRATSGAVWLGERPMVQLPPGLGDVVAPVPQDPVILAATVRENVLLGRRIDDAELDRAVSVSQLHRDPAQLPQGLDTLVGVRGATLSGGPRQRVAIARALVGRPSILVLDDATSALAAEVEAAFWAALERELPGVGVLLITHRPATLARVDEAVVLEDGRVVERGTPGELLAGGGPYARLYTAVATPSTAGGDRERRRGGR